MLYNLWICQNLTAPCINEWKVGVMKLRKKFKYLQKNYYDNCCSILIIESYLGFQHIFTYFGVLLLLMYASIFYLCEKKNLDHDQNVVSYFVNSHKNIILACNCGTNLLLIVWISCVWRCDLSVNLSLIASWCDP